MRDKLEDKLGRLSVDIELPKQVYDLVQALRKEFSGESRENITELFSAKLLALVLLC